LLSVVCATPITCSLFSNTLIPMATDIVHFLKNYRVLRSITTEIHGEGRSKDGFGR
jgi:hypothetical protein